MLKYTGYNIVFREIPDEVTLAVNLSNCPHKCEGCHSAYLRMNIGEELTQEALFAIIDRYGEDITCVCFMGGDASPEELSALAGSVKQHYPLKTAWYSGNKTVYDERCKPNFDFIKLGEYRAALGGLDSPTTNQRLYRIQGRQLIDITARMQQKSHIDRKNVTPLAV